MWQSRGARATPRRHGERGMVTVELAFAVLVCVAVVAGLMQVVALGLSQARLQATAAEVARQAARNDTVAVARAMADRAPGAQIVISREGRAVRVRASQQSRPWGPWIPGVALTAEAVVLREPS